MGEIAALDAREIGEWMAYDRIQPIGGERGDLGHAIVASTIANAFRDRRSGRPLTPSDFMPKFGSGGGGARQSDAEMWANLRLYAKAHNAALERQAHGN